MKDNKENKKKKVNKNTINYKLNKKIGFKLYELILFSVLIVAATIFLTYVVVCEVKDIKSFSGISSLTSSERLEEFEEVYNLINNKYYKKVNEDDLINGAINGMLYSLGDIHTSYFDEAETETFNDLMNGSYEGIGAEITLDLDGSVYISSIFKNSPADEVGLKFKDIILEVNGKSTEGMTPTEVVALIKDVNIKTAHIKVRRVDQILEFDVTKRIVVIESVESEIITKNGKKIGYVAVNNFASNTYSQFRTQIEAMETKNIEGLVIDVRNNSGGYLHAVTSMIEMFTSQGKTIYQIQDRIRTDKYVDKSPESRTYPITVLINDSSASASEILAISLMESYGAKVVGVNSYGKGTVQVTENLRSGGMIKYTIQKWLSPEGNWINEKGVTPTHKVELSKEYELNPIKENDNQLQKALDVVSK